MDLIAFVFLFVVCPTWLYVIMVICSVFEIKVVDYFPQKVQINVKFATSAIAFVFW